MMPLTVIQHVLSRLRSIGIADVFGVPGDFSFPVNDAICEDPQIRWIGCCNELNAAYAADGYARVKGIGAISTTYGVGELSALAGVAGAYAEHVPLFHLVGAPNMSAQSARAILHHTLGNGEYNLFQRMSEPVVCAQAVMTPQNVVFETERLIAEAFYHRRPVYMAFPADFANEKAIGSAQPVPASQSDPGLLFSATDAIVAVLARAKTACVLPGILIARSGLKSVMQAVIDASNLPFATMFMDKSVLDEQHPNYIGMYDGRLMNEEVRQFVESCDSVLEVGTMLSDFNSGAFTARLDPAKTIRVSHHQTQAGGKTFSSVEMRDVLAALAKRLPKRDGDKKLQVSSLGPPVGQGTDPIAAASLYPRWANFLRRNDILVAETGTCSMGLGFAKMPAGATFHNQTLWGAIGWATPAAFGAAVAAPDRRVVLVTGEGSHQITAQEISQFGRLGLRPIIFVLNNSGYLIERLLCKNPAIAYNEVAQWRYAELPHALGCDNWFTARATTCGELDQALEIASRSNTAAYVEVVTDAYAASPLALKLQESLKTLYKS
ncbi:MAG TPA: thiamine pyrophosphate-binding protein [Candidatus Acidoferrales bacterium]|nr:thiamine pyrophosphate-binding protein [Candidatus Acidoferrales bacterium]